MGWKDRNAAIEAAARDYLGKADAKTIAPMGSYELAQKLALDHRLIAHKLSAGEMARILSRIAPYMPGLATHDGETMQRYGRTWQRWRWHPKGGL